MHFLLDIIVEQTYSDAVSSVSLDRSNIVLDPNEFPHLSDLMPASNPPHSLSLEKLPGKMDFFDDLLDGPRLKTALSFAQKIKDQILADTSYRCSVGVAANRVSAS